MWWCGGRFLIIAAAAAWITIAAAAQRLPAFDAHSDRITVSGLSSGAFMAVQLAVAHSARVNGVGVFAGGPYYCVGINPTRAESICMQGSPGAGSSIKDAERLATLRLIDSTQNLRGMRAWLLAGEADSRVVTPVVRANYEFFAHYNVSGAQFRVQPGLGHGLPTPTQGVACDASASPFINRCGVDLVGEMLTSLHPGASKSPGPGPGPSQGRIVVFGQAEFVPTWRRWWAMSSLGATGYAFVPSQCEKNTKCRVHVALHGCHQGVTAVGEVFVRDAGYNAWAAAHDLIVLYPQAQASQPTMFTWWLPFNPNGCWDWWGYTGTDYAVKTGVQVKAIMAMIDRLAQPR
ncbi:MAG TPA: depolymerase [Burkholderiaceae bacterium]|nr:depolymerase [Burkholderiaceae bacterium]